MFFNKIVGSCILEITLEDATPRGDTLLHMSAFTGKQSIAAMLFDKHNVDSEYVNKGLLKGDSKVNGSNVDTEGWTALHIVCALGLVKFTQYLLEKGASKLIKTAKGKTPANIAKDYKHDKIVDILSGKPEKKGPGFKRAPTKAVPVGKPAPKTGVWKK